MNEHCVSREHGAETEGGARSRLYTHEVSRGNIGVVLETCIKQIVLDYHALNIYAYK